MGLQLLGNLGDVIHRKSKRHDLKFWNTINGATTQVVGDQARILTALWIGLPLGTLSHAGFLILFWTLGFPVLALFNIFSVALFAFATWQLYRNNLSWAVYGCILFELPLHATMATLYLGFNAGFWLLAFISVAFIPLYPMLSRIVRVLIGFALVLGIGSVALIAIKNGSIYTVSTALSSFFLLMNLVFLALVVTVIIVSYDLAVERAEQAQQEEYDRAEMILHNVLPARITARLKSHEEPIADSHENVSVLFADIAGFTNLSRNLTARNLVSLLNELFTRFDASLESVGAEKIKTIGDAYMAATGLEGENDHAEKMVDLAVAMQRSFEEFRQKNDLDLKLRIGVHSGAVMAGVIGKQKFAYDLWGNTVNVASRMESEGVADRIQISAETLALLPERFQAQSRGEIKIKGHRVRECFLLE